LKGFEFLDDVGMPGGDVGLFGRIVFDIEEVLADELVVSLEDGGEADAAGDFEDDLAGGRVVRDGLVVGVRGRKRRGQSPRSNRRDRPDNPDGLSWSR